MNKCNPEYINRLKVSDQVKEDLIKKHRDIFDELREDKKLFIKRTTDANPDTTRYYLPQNIAKYKEAAALIRKINEREAARVVGVGHLKNDPDAQFVFVNVTPLADAYNRKDEDRSNYITAHGDSVVTSLPANDVTKPFHSPLFSGSTISGNSFVTPTTDSRSFGNSPSGTTTTSTTSGISDFNRADDINKKYPFAEKMINDVGVEVKIVGAGEVKKGEPGVKATYDPWDNTIKATKTASPETVMHEVMHGVLFKSAKARSEETFRKSPLGRDLERFNTRLTTLPEDETIDHVIESVNNNSIQESATYGVLNYKFAKALNDSPSPNAKTPSSTWTDIATSTLKGLKIKDNSKLAELLTILEKHTSGKKDSFIAPKLAEGRQEEMNKQFDLLKSIGSKVKFVSTEEDGHITTHFEINGEHVKYKTPDENVGIKSVKGKKIAERARKDISNILDRFIDKDGLLRDEALPKDERYIPSNQRVYDMMEEVLNSRLSSYPAGTKFIHSTNIYSEARNKASKLDFLALMPNGKADLLAFDMISKGNWSPIAKNSKTFDISVKDQEAIRDYLNQTKGILKTAYNIKDFDQTRSVPMYIETSPKANEDHLVSASWDGLNSGNNRKKIDEVPTWDESTGNKDTDNLVKKLVALFEAKGGEKASKSNTLSKEDITRTIRAIQLEKGIPKLINLIDSSAKSSEGAVKNFIDNLQGKDSSKFSISDLSNQTQRLNRSSKELDMYGQIFDSYYKDFYKNPTDKEKEMLSNLEKASARARFALVKLNDVKREFIQDKIAMKYGIENLLIPEKKVDAYGAWTKTFSDPTTKAQTLFFRMIDNARNQYQNKTRESFDKLSKIFEDIQGWMKGKSNTDLLELIKRKDKYGNRKNELIGQFKAEYYKNVDEKAEQLLSKDKDVVEAARKWLEDNVDKQALNEWAVQQKEDRLAWVNKTFAQDHEFYETQIGKTHAMYDISKPFIYKNVDAMKRFPDKEKWTSEEFKNLERPENAPVLALYQYTREINKLAARIGYIEADKSARFLPSLRKSLADKLAFGGTYSWMDSILDNLTVSKIDADYGKYDRIANETIDTLPKYFVGDLGTEKVGPDGKKYMDYSNVSDDIVKNLALYTAKVHEYAGKSELEEMTKMLLWAEKNKESLQINEFGNVVTDSEPKMDNTENYQILRDFVQNQLYGQAYVKSKYTDAASRIAINERWNKVAAKVNKTLGFEFMPPQAEERRMSLMKALQSMQALQNLKVLGLNIGASTYRFIGTNVQGWVNSGEYYTTTELFKHDVRHAALQVYKGDADLHIALMKQFWPVDSQMKHEIDKMSLSKLTQHSLSDWMMKLIEHAHDYVQYVNFGAMMDNTVIIDGKIHNARKYIRASEDYRARYDVDATKRSEIESGFEDRVKALIDEHGLIKKSSFVDGKLKIEGLDLDDMSVAQFKTNVRAIGRKLSGNISSEDESRLRMTVLGRQLLMFKNWATGMIETRARELSWKESVQGYEWGRIRMMTKVVLQHHVRAVDKLISMYRATEAGVGLMESLYNKKKADFEKQHLEEFKMSKEEFYDLVRKNIAQQTKEVIAMTALASIAAGIMAAGHNSDDAHKGYWKFAERTLERSYEEINLYYNPVTAGNLLNGSLFPTLGLVIDVGKFTNSVMQSGLGHIEGDEKKIEKAHVAKNAMHMIPILSQVPNVIGIAAPDFAKELGINYSATPHK